MEEMGKNINLLIDALSPYRGQTHATLSKLVKLLPSNVIIVRKNMHQIGFPLGLRPRPRWGSLQCLRSPKPPSCI